MNEIQDNEETDQIKGFCSSICFIPRSAIDEKPIIVKLTTAEMRDLVINQAPHVEQPESDDSDADEPKEAMETEDIPTAIIADVTEDDETAQKYKFANYESEVAPPPIGAVTKIFSDKPDPYLTGADEEEKDDLADLEVHENENLVAFVLNDLDDSELCFSNFNHVNFHSFVRNSTMLDKPPLVIKYLHPDASEKDGNITLVAVGYYEPVIELWDVNIIDGAAPVYSLGKNLSKSQKKNKELCATTHLEAVTTLAWSPNMGHVLASGSVDKRVILWDISSETAATIYSFFGEEIQTLSWHPFEIGVLLVGTVANNLYLINCGQDMTGESAVKFAIDEECEIEAIDWDRQNPFLFYVSDATGNLYTFNSTISGGYQSKVKSHDNPTNVVLASRTIGGLVVSAGYGDIIVWKADVNGVLTKVFNVKSLIGTIFSGDFCPENNNVLGFAGNEGEKIQFVDISTFEEIAKAFA
uniref:WD_REPEATS_REGION domain-containing protein n=1 Tax=Rhabditophanes sp. KR3021 TaxID=114890 RepID=A0AC35UD40_9BILA